MSAIYLLGISGSALDRSWKFLRDSEMGAVVVTGIGLSGLRRDVSQFRKLAQLNTLQSKYASNV